LIRTIASATRSIAATLLLAIVLAGGCSPAPSTTHDALTAGAEPLRSRFNRDVGHTRILLLAAPT
jgi:hypothetical protein